MRASPFLFVLGTIAALGCSSSNFDVAGGDTGPGVSDEQGCTDLANARCNKWSSCSQVFIATQYGDATTCVGRIKQLCLNIHGAPSSGSTAAGSEKCAPAVTAQTCADVLDGVQPGACSVAAGGESDGAPCAFDTQCANRFCLLPKDAQCGTCGSTPPVGSSCASTLCPSALECPESTMTCTAQGQNGAPCDRGLPCASGLSCVGAGAGSKGTCVASATTVGAPCDPTRHAGPGCDRNAGVGCDLVSSKCVPVQIVAASAPCDDEVQFCGGGGRCFFPVGSKIGTCSAPAADGASCDTAIGPACLSPARCVRAGAGTNGTCVFPNASPCH